MKKGYLGDPFKNNRSIWQTSPFNPSDIVTKEKLLAPFITVIQNEENHSVIEVKWNIVLNAEKYRVYINEKLIDTVVTTSFIYDVKKNGIYEIYVRAYGNGYSASNKSNIVIIEIKSLKFLLFSGLKFITSGLRRILIKE